MVENYHKFYGRYPETFPGDGIYMNRKKPRVFCALFWKSARNTEICLKNCFFEKIFYPESTS